MARFPSLTRILPLLLAVLMLAGCATVPLTGRSQLNFIPDSQMNSLSFQQYKEVIARSELSDNAKYSEGIKKVGGRIQGAVEEYFRSKGMSDQLAGYQWEFNLIESEEVNAWCMPGGKVAFYTGILPICKDETGLAVVMGHEVAHAIAKHGGERMSQGLLLQIGGMALCRGGQVQTRADPIPVHDRLRRRGPVWAWSCPTAAPTRARPTAWG